MELKDVLEKLKEHMRFKPSTVEGDIVLVGMPSGLFYGTVRSIDRNIKKDWFNMSFTLLAVPPADVTWILRTPQMSGEIFTINGEAHFVIAVDMAGGEEKKEEDAAPRKARPGKRGLTLVKNTDDDAD